MHPLTAPVLAVLSDQADRELIRLASDIADDFLLWPIRRCELRERLSRILEPHQDHIESVTQRLTVELGLIQVVGKHPTYLKIINQLPSIAKNDVPVLIDGETGTGKDLCARALHFLSARRSYPFIPVDCGAIPDHLFENEFFGHARGAFTDAYASQPGLAAMAEGGTLFLDEIDTLSPTNQIKLLRFLQERSYRPLGAHGFQDADVRIIAATNSDLEKRVSTGAFRSDLYFRVNVLRLSLPPLRQRRSDIPLLAVSHLKALRSSPPSISPSAIRVLQTHDWPGNIRELFNVIHRAMIRSGDRQIGARHIDIPESRTDTHSEPRCFGEARSQVIESFERKYLIDVLARHNGNITQAAREAGKERRAFGRLVKKYSIDPHKL
jgi:two-component system response regulator GlrR